jgi:GNAT superfamily N-acetyltransferase
LLAILLRSRVGRVELNQEDVAAIHKDPPLSDALKGAYSSGYKVLYLFGPSLKASEFSATTDAPGMLVDVKTTYSAPLFGFDTAAMCKSAFMTPGVSIRPHNPSQTELVSESLRNLAIASGQFSRFKVDPKFPNEGFEGMFDAWITNSANRSLADEVFLAYDTTADSSAPEVGFITLKKRGNTVNIGLLAVSDQHRRRGIAKALLSRAVLWALEVLGSSSPDATMNVVTQGANQPACACYEHFGFGKDTMQEVYHVWLPEHLPGPLARADQDRIPFCKQHFTGKELVYATQVINSGLDSASNFTMMCAARIREMLGPDSDRVVMVPSGTAALEMAALLCELKPGDEVILPSYTFSSTGNCFVLQGAVPVFVDVRSDTLNIDETLIEAAITERTRAICAVHYAGLPCEMDTICAIAKKHNLFVIEDAAQGNNGHSYVLNDSFMFCTTRS